MSLLEIVFNLYEFKQTNDEKIQRANMPIMVCHARLTVSDRLPHNTDCQIYQSANCNSQCHNHNNFIYSQSNQIYAKF